VPLAHYAKRTIKDRETEETNENEEDDEDDESRD